MPAPEKYWTEERIAELMAYRANASLSNRVIAREMGRSHASVAYAIKKNKLLPRRQELYWTEARLTALDAYRRNDDLTNPMIAEIIGATLPSLRYAVARYNLPRRISKPVPLWNSRRLDELRELLATRPRLSYNAIALALGVTKSTIAGAIFRHLQPEPEFPELEPARMIEFPERGCQWMHGDVNAPDFRFCGAPAIFGPEGRVWCEAHRKKVYLKPSKAAA